MPANGRAPRGDGKWNRKHTADDLRSIERGTGKGEKARATDRYAAARREARCG